MEFILSEHAKEQMIRRGISYQEIEAAVQNPTEIFELSDKLIYHAIDDSGKLLLRIFVNKLKTPNLVITVYRTSKIKKYYEGEVR